MGFKYAVLFLLSFSIYFGSSSAYAKLELNPALRVSELIDAEGSIYLFRYISQPYKPGKLGIVSQHTGLVSYTINPLIFLNGQRMGYEPTAPQMLVSKLKSSERLSYVTQNSGIGENPLLGTTRIADFGTQFEVEVPVGHENVVLIMPMEEFLSKTKGTQDIKTRQDYFAFLKRVFQKTAATR